MTWLHDYATRWHDAWDIVGAIATTAAVFVALNGIRLERRRARSAETERDHERAQNEAERSANRQAEHRRQAQRMIAYAVWTVDVSDFRGESGHWKIKLSNHSDAPVFDVYLETYMHDVRINATDSPALPPNADVWVDHKELRAPADRPVPLLYFRDLAGTRWRRDHAGVLVEVEENGEPRISLLA